MKEMVVIATTFSFIFDSSFSKRNDKYDAIFSFVKRIIAIVIILVLAGCLFENLERKGFSEKDLVAPLPYLTKFDEKPCSNTMIPISYQYEIKIEYGIFYPYYNNALRITINNTGSSKLFIYGFAIDMDGIEEKDVWNDGKIVDVGKEESFIFSFKCPSPGNYKYKLGVYFMAGRRNRWHDYGLVYTKEEKEIEIKEFFNTNYKLYKNYYYYFDKINELVNPYDTVILKKAKEISSPYGDDYNIAKICAIYDWIYENVEYKNDTNDEWVKPSEALYEGGDCEEFAMLVASMVEAIGGIARIYLTDNHAFAAIYVGRDLYLLDYIDFYYHANLSYALFEDEFGYWLVADPLSAPYLGGLPVGGVVEGGEGKIYEWSILTNKLYAIDVLKE